MSFLEYDFVLHKSNRHMQNFPESPSPSVALESVRPQIFSQVDRRRGDPDPGMKCKYHLIWQRCRDS